jgi:3-oxoacyl-[acyl-carrier protein] reductase
MMKRFEGKVVLITGAAGGLGSDQCRVFAEEGAAVAINYLDVGNFAKEAANLADSLKSNYGGDHQCYSADITNEAEVKRMVEKINDHFGKIDVLVNNAGISINAVSWEISAENWSKVLAVNLTGSLYCSKAVLPGMRERRYGRIICISSVVGLSGARGTVAYAASKAALIGMSKTMAREVANRGITVNCVAPGYIDSGIMSEVPDKFKTETVIPSIPMGRLGESLDIARAVAFLASDDAKYITGEVLRVDGGHSM